MKEMDKLRKEFDELQKKLLVKGSKISEEVDLFAYGSRSMRDGIEINWMKLAELRCPIGKPKCTDPPYQERMELRRDHYICGKCGFRLSKKMLDDVLPTIKRIDEIWKMSLKK